MSEYFSPLSSDSEYFVDASDNELEDFDKTLPDTVTLLYSHFNKSKVYLIGTAHFSKQSQDDVINVIRSVKPHIVVVELCSSRQHVMSMNENKLRQETKNLNFSKVIEIIQQNGAFSGIMIVLFYKINAQLIEQFGMAPGGEFRAAYNEAKKYPNCIIEMGDRSIGITLKRALAKLSWWQTIKLVFQMCFFNGEITKEEMESYKNKDILESLISRMTQEYPILKTVFVDERDVYLTHSIQVAANSQSHLNLNSDESLRIVAVMGMGHVPGIIMNWPILQEPFISELMLIPKQSKSTTIIKFTFKTTAIFFGCYLFLRVIPVKNSLNFVKAVFFNSLRK